ncbi:hypothetical protein FA95DRAFT_108116 [Auriscalpium vulgare]|uniref:Uncharacterized protein n=1 Tax=Auriscalpium vulgare TaxID=40419 RepID=A0ACB8S6U8_9AGAM|nr:hypothetical protein FA95DRAFT_108116 [Auriscalpium vulgare]
MHNLEVLEMELELDPFDSLRHEVSTSRRIVAPANLQHLALVADLTATRIFFSHLALPLEVSVLCRIYPCADSELVEDVAAVLSTVLASIGPDAHSASKKPINIVGLGVRKNRCDGWDVDVTAWRNEDHSIIGVGFYEGLDRDQMLAHSALKAFMSENLESLAVAMFGDIEDVAWVDSVRDNPKLQRMTVLGKAALTLCDELRPSDSGAADQVDKLPTVFLPALSTLSLSEVDFRSDNLAPGMPLAEALPKYLAERARLGYVLKELDVSCCGADEACVQRLRDAVPGMVVICDERSEGDEEEASGDGDEEEAIANWLLIKEAWASYEGSEGDEDDSSDEGSDGDEDSGEANELNHG